MTPLPVPRWVDDSIAAALQDTPAIAMNGARQVGKSTLAAALAYPGSAEFVTLDDPDSRAAANLDPRAFVQRRVDTLVINEVQLVPALFRAIKAEIDRDRRPGRFLLTGSSRLLSAPDMADALVGRVETIELWPFAQCEIEDARRRSSWLDSYVTTEVERTILQISDIQRTADLPRLLRLCAARTAQELNTSNLADEFGIPAKTVGTYLAHLANAFLVHPIPAWSVNLSSKVIRRPKLVMVDTGLAAHLLGTGPTSLASPQSPLGALLETFVATEVMKQLTWSDNRPRLHHFRDRNGAEVDLVLDYPDGRVVGIEVKATSTPRAEDYRGLRWLADKLGPRFAHGILLSTTPEAIPFGPNLAALPVDVRWRRP